MEENNQKNQNQVIVIVGLIALIIGLTVSVKLVFAGLDMAIDSEDNIAASSQAVQVDGSNQNDGADVSVESGGQGVPSFCTHCGEEMRDGFQWGQYCPYCGKLVE